LAAPGTAGAVARGASERNAEIRDTICHAVTDCVTYPANRWVLAACVRRATRHVHAPPPAALTVHPQTSTERPKPNCGRNAGSRHHITLTLTLSGHQVAPPASGGCPPPSIRRRAAAKPPPPMHPAACVAASPSPLQPSVVGHPNSNRQRRPSLGPSAGHSARLGLSPVTAPRRASCRTAPRR
jgi:hypothetical protein